MTDIFDDIRKLYSFRDPHPELATYIEFFSETSQDATARYVNEDGFTIRLFPSFTPTIWLNMGSPYQIINGKQLRCIDKTSDVLVLRSTILERKNLPTDNIFTIKFRPLGFEAIFGISQSIIGNDIIEASEILGVGVIKKIKSLASLKERALLLEKIFLEKLQHNSQGRFSLECIKKSIDLFLLSRMSLKLDDLASRLNVSEKTFYRYFHKTIGTNPKSFFSSTRCRTALTSYKNNKSSFSPYDFGYYDFGHFSKDVTRFTGSNITSFNT